MEIAYSLGTYDRFRPLTRNKMVELGNREWLTGVIYKGAYAVFLCLTSLLVVMAMTAGATLWMVMMMVMMLMFLMVMLMFVVMMLMFLMVMLMFIVMMLMFLMMVMLIFFLIFHFVKMFLYFLHPCRRACHGIEVTFIGVEKAIKVYITIVTFYNARLWLYGTENLLSTPQLTLCNLRSLVKKYGVAELYLLYHKVLDILLGNIFLQKVYAAFKLIAKSQSVDNADDTVKTYLAIACVFLAHVAYGTESLGYRHRLADA